MPIYSSYSEHKDKYKHIKRTGVRPVASSAQNASRILGPIKSPEFTMDPEDSDQVRRE